MNVSAADAPIARDVIALQRKYPPSPVGTRLRTRMMGGIYVEEACLYPLPAAVPG